MYSKMLTQFDDLQLNNYLSPVSEDVVFFEDGVKYRAVYQYYIKLLLSHDSAKYEALVKTPNLYAVYSTHEQYAIPRETKKKAMVAAYLAKFKHLKADKLAAFKASVRYMYVAHTNPRFPRREWSPSLLNDVLQEVHNQMFLSPKRVESVFPVEPEPKEPKEPKEEAVVADAIDVKEELQEPKEEVAKEEEAATVANAVNVKEEPQEPQEPKEEVVADAVVAVADAVAVKEELEEASLEAVAEDTPAAPSANIRVPISVSTTGGAAEYGVSLYLLKKYGVSWSGEASALATLERYKAAGLICETSASPL